MQKIIPFLWFDGQAEEAMNFYVSIFKNAKMLSVTRYGAAAAGGRADQCGWLQDKYGLSWQIIPTALGRMLGDRDPEKANRVMQAMLKMKKIDINGLQQAYDGG